MAIERAGRRGMGKRRSGRSTANRALTPPRTRRAVRLPLLFLGLPVSAKARHSMRGRRGQRRGRGGGGGKGKGKSPSSSSSSCAVHHPLYPTTAVALEGNKGSGGQRAVEGGRAPSGMGEGGGALQRRPAERRGATPREDWSRNERRGGGGGGLRREAGGGLP